MISLQNKSILGSIDNELVSFFKKNIHVIFDVGCKDGSNLFYLLNQFPNSTIYGFEPHPFNYKKLLNEISSLKIDSHKIITNSAILSDVNSEIPLNIFFNSGSDNSSILRNYKQSSILNLNEHFKENGLSVETTLKIDSYRLIDFVNSNNISVIDFLQLDIDGAELLILKGAERFIKNIKMLSFKVQPQIYLDQPLNSEIENYCKSNGFSKLKDFGNGSDQYQLWVNYKWFPRKKVTHLLWKSYETIFKTKKVKDLDESTYFKKSFSQTGEDLIINFIFQTKGLSSFSYLDIGANHPYYMSNTHSFYQNGNRGINIEPNPTLFKLLEKYRPNDINLNIGISDSTTELTYYFFDIPALNTFSKEEKDKYIGFGHKLIAESIVKVDTIESIINKHFNAIFPNVLFVDVEGLDFDIIKSIDFTKRSLPNVICVETLSYSNDNTGAKNLQMIEYIKSKGYFLYADTYINTIFVNEEFWKT
jgi:FkbM family methyltransferase